MSTRPNEPDDEMTADTETTEHDETGTDEGDVEIIIPAAKPKSGRGFVMAGFLLASFLGGAIGWLGPKYLDKSPDPVASLAEQSRKSIQSLQQDLDQKSQTIASLDTRLKKLQSQNDEITGFKTDVGSALEAITTRLEALEERLDTLAEQQPVALDTDALAASVKPLQERMDALEALSTKPGTDNTGASALISRLDGLESKLDTISEIEEKIAILESDLADIESKAPPVANFPKPDAKPIKLPVISDEQARSSALAILADTFPREKMIEAAKAQAVLAQTKPGWLRQMLDKHVKVRKTAAPDPLKAIDKADAQTRNGDIKGAIATIKTLNPPVRAIAANWVKSAKIYLKSKP